jgi:colanic acid/amylovoran biosynthesis glycosyltransferase
MNSTVSSVQPREIQAESGQQAGSPRVGYLVSRYPAVSHTFILREILELRKLGFCIETASINLPDRESSELTLVEEQEFRSTVYIKSEGPFRALRALFGLLARRPRSFFSALAFTMSIGNGSFRETMTNVFYLAEAALLGSWLARRKFKHLHVHFGNAASTVAMIAARAYPITFSITIHGPEEFYEVGRSALRQKAEAARFVCCIGPYARSQLMKVSHSSNWPKYRVSPLGVDPGEFPPRPFRRSPERWEILCVGRLTPAKGQMVLLQSLKRLLAEGRNIHCLFIGDGSDRADLAAYATRHLPSEAVAFLGAVNPDRIRDYLYRTDIFVLPSFAEGVPIALMEAMSMEVPCISTMIAGVPELIRNGVDGLLVSPSDELELASTLGLVMDDQHLRRRLGEAGRARILSRYNLSKNVRMLAEIMKCELANPD